MDKEKGMSEFLKKAYEQGRVKPLKDAFLEFPPEEEWHKGRVDYFIKDGKAQYNSIYNIGDIVFVREYYYIDGTLGTNHLFVIIDKNNSAVPIENFGMLISSNLKKIKYESNKLIKKDNKNNLDTDSIVKTDYVYTILDQDILFKIGMVDSEKIEDYKNSFDVACNNRNKE